jgi:hypothetical protein
VIYGFKRKNPRIVFVERMTNAGNSSYFPIKKAATGWTGRGFLIDGKKGRGRPCSLFCEAVVVIGPGGRWP